MEASKTKFQTEQQIKRPNFQGLIANMRTTDSRLQMDSQYSKTIGCHLALSIRSRFLPFHWIIYHVNS